MKLLYDLKEKYTCCFVKGNKEDYWINYEAWRGENWKEYDSTSGMLCGHTHRQGVTEHKSRLAINVGSVGVSLNADGKAQFALLYGENGKWTNELCNVKYDVEHAISDMQEAGFMKKHLIGVR